MFFNAVALALKCGRATQFELSLTDFVCSANRCGRNDDADVIQFVPSAIITLPMFALVFGTSACRNVSSHC
jgi:hypothetical protein